MSKAKLIAMRLAKEGFGTPEQILRMPVGLALDALAFSTFATDYEAAYVELNKGSS